MASPSKKLVDSHAKAASDSVCLTRWEVSLYGLSVAVIDSAPRELVQLNLRGMRLFRDLTSVGVEYHALVNSITVDNMLPDTINPLVLRSGLSTTTHFTADDVEHAQEPAAAAVDLERVTSPAPRSSASMLLPGRGLSAQSRGEDGVGWLDHGTVDGDTGESSEGAERRDSEKRDTVALELRVHGRREKDTYRLVSLVLAPLNLVIDLSLLQATTKMQASSHYAEGELRAHSVAERIVCSEHMRTTFELLRDSGIKLPRTVLRKNAPDNYFQRVSIATVHVHLTVAMSISIDEDPIRELLQVVEQLLPKLPKSWEIGMRAALPVLSNIASITDASFHLAGYEMADEFATVYDIGKMVVGSFWSNLTVQLLRAMMSSDIIGNPLGIYERVKDRGESFGKGAQLLWRTREGAQLKRLGAELADLVAGSGSEFLSKLLRSVHSCVSAIGLTTSENRRLVGRERPKDVVEGLRACKRVMWLTVEDASRTLCRSPCQARATGGAIKFLQELGNSGVKCLASPVTGALGGAAVLLSSVDKTTRRWRVGAHEDVTRSRPPRRFDPRLPQLALLSDHMVVHLQIVLESLTQLRSGLNDQELSFTFKLCSASNPAGDGEPISTPAVGRSCADTAAYRIWDEVVVLRPQARDAPARLLVPGAGCPPPFLSPSLVLWLVRLGLVAGAVLFYRRVTDGRDWTTLCSCSCLHTRPAKASPLSLLRRASLSFRSARSAPAKAALRRMWAGSAGTR